jgi:hypothetical protein
MFARGNGVSNAKPIGHVNAPLHSSTIVAGSGGIMSIHTKDFDGFVNRVDWFINDTYSLTASAFPFSASYANAPVGVHKVQAAIYDTAGEYRWSDPIWITVSASASSPDTLQPGERLYPNQQRRSSNGLYLLVYQTDGNLVLYGPSGPIVWTGGFGVGYAEMELGGNLVMRNGSGQVVWQSFTSEVGSGLRVRDNGTVAILSPNHKGNVPIWSAP